MAGRARLIRELQERAARALPAQVLDRLPSDALGVEVDDRPTSAWFAAWHAVHGGDPRAEWDLLARVERPTGFARAMLGEDVVAVGRVVAGAVPLPLPHRAG